VRSSEIEGFPRKAAGYPGKGLEPREAMRLKNPCAKQQGIQEKALNHAKQQVHNDESIDGGKEGARVFPPSKPHMV